MSTFYRLDIMKQKLEMQITLKTQSFWNTFILKNNENAIQERMEGYVLSEQNKLPETCKKKKEKKKDIKSWLKTSSHQKSY